MVAYPTTKRIDHLKETYLTLHAPVAALDVPSLFGTLALGK